MKLDILYLIESNNPTLLERMLRFARKWYGKDIKPIFGEKSFKLRKWGGSENALFFNDSHGSSAVVFEEHLDMKPEDFWEKFIKTSGRGKFSHPADNYKDYLTIMRGADKKYVN